MKGEKKTADKGLATMLFIYNLFWTVPLFFFWLVIPFMLVSEKRRPSFLKRLGFLPSRTERILRKRRKNKLIWIHALSAGETAAGLIIARELARRYQDLSFVFSVTTKAGYEMARTNLAGLPAEVIHFPYDLLFSCAIMAKKINPDSVILVETDIWPNFLWCMHRRKIPVLLVNARMSDSSFRGYMRLSSFFRPFFSIFSFACVQSEKDRTRFTSAGILNRRIAVTGNLKSEIVINETEKGQNGFVESLEFKDGSILVAGSTHPKEESIIKDALVILKKRGVRILTVIVPRDPKRCDEVGEIFQKAGFVTRILEGGDKRMEVTADVILVKAVGLLARLYSRADIAFVGGSLVDEGGHNLMEPASCGVPVIFGPYTRDFADMAQRLEKCGGGLRVNDTAELAMTLLSLCENKEKARIVGHAAKRALSESRGGLERVMEVIAGAAGL